jgi:hypothetical protein
MFLTDIRLRADEGKKLLKQMCGTDVVDILFEGG